MYTTMIIALLRHVTVVTQLANPRHPRPVHISRYGPLNPSNITRYEPDFDREYYKKKKKKSKKRSIANLAVHVVNVLFIAHTGNTVLDARPHGCTVRACIGRYCLGAWPITHNQSDMLPIILIMYVMTCYVYSIYMTCIALSSRNT